MAYRPVKTEGPLVTFNARKLAVLSPALWSDINKHVPLKDQRIVATRVLPQDLQERLAEALPLLKKMVEPGSAEENVQFNKAQLDMAVREADARAKQKALQDSGDQQLQLYRAAGLADTERNSRLITEYIQKHANGVYCAPSVRAAVEGERINLEWVKITPQPAARPAPAEPTVTLPDGSKQLPLGTTPARHHSIAQLRDLDARERAARGRGSWHGAKF